MSELEKCKTALNTCLNLKNCQKKRIEELEELILVGSRLLKRKDIEINDLNEIIEVLESVGAIEIKKGELE